jgi:restriction endonuclease S subunit
MISLFIPCFVILFNKVVLLNSALGFLVFLDGKFRSIFNIQRIHKSDLEDLSEYVFRLLSF